MRLCSVPLYAAVAIVLAGRPALAKHINPSPTHEHGDLWEFTNLSSATSSGQIFGTGTDVRNLFGATLGFLADGAGGYMLFRDDQSGGFVHYAEWTTEDPITVRSISLDAFHDQLTNRSLRGFNEFRLYAWNLSTSAFDLIYSHPTGNPYGDTVAPPGTTLVPTNTNILRLFADLTPTTTNRWRAEFVQSSPSPSSASGPRINELNAFDTFHVVPEPATAALIAVALLCFVALGGRRHSA